MTASFSLPVRVYIEDTDAGGIVYYVNYLKFMERARTEFLRDLGFKQYLLAQENFQFVVRDCQIRYRKPAVIDDQLSVTVTLEKLGRASMDFTQTVERDGECLCQALVRVACVSADSLSPVPLPDDIHNAMKKETR
jgi:4-hydroxybenzoyl-CoA thioesterase